MSARTTAAKALLEARDALLAAQAAAQRAADTYKEAEKTYIGTFSDGSVHNVLVDSHHLVMPKDDWFEMLEGQRLEFHTVERLS